MSKGGPIAHIDGIPDEAVNAAFIAGAIYLGWKLVHKAATPSPVPPAPGPPSTVLPPPPGGHLDGLKPPARLAGTGGAPSLIYHAPGSWGHRDYYGSGPSIPPPQGWDHTGQLAAAGAAAGAAGAAVGAGVNAAMGAAAATYAPPPPPAPQPTMPGPGSAEHAANRAAVAAQSRPKRGIGTVVGPPVPTFEAKPAAKQRQVAY